MAALHEVSWNKKEIAELFPKCKNVGDLVTSIEDFFSDKGEVVCEIRVNDILLSEKDETRLSAARFSEVQKVGVKTSSIVHLVIEASSSTEEYIQRLKEVSLRNADLFSTDDLAQAQKVFISVLEGTQWLTDMLVQIGNVAGSLQEPGNREAWQNTENEYSRIAADLSEAFERKDFLSVAEILEYDWTNVLTEWEDLLKGLSHKGDGLKEDGQSTLG